MTAIRLQGRARSSRGWEGEARSLPSPAQAKIFSLPEPLESCSYLDTLVTQLPGKVTHVRIHAVEKDTSSVRTVR